jgi:hypothetical protein
LCAGNTFYPYPARAARANHGGREVAVGHDQQCRKAPVTLCGPGEGAGVYLTHHYRIGVSRYGCTSTDLLLSINSRTERRRRGGGGGGARGAARGGGGGVAAGGLQTSRRDAGKDYRAECKCTDAPSVAGVHSIVPTARSVHNPLLQAWRGGNVSLLVATTHHTILLCSIPLRRSNSNGVVQQKAEQRRRYRQGKKLYSSVAHSAAAA